MKYYTKELWIKMQDPDKAARNRASEEWKENDAAYHAQFLKAQKRLSHSFIKNYLSRNGFHDYEFTSIEFSRKGKSYSCKLQLTDGEETVLLVMSGIKALQINIASFSSCIQGKLSWAYDEFEITPENNILLSILCDPENELQFEFKSIRFKKT